jgi:hypothetical protein
LKVRQEDCFREVIIPAPFNRVIFDEPVAHSPGWSSATLPETARQALFREGVPERFLGYGYRADPCVRCLRIAAGVEALRFGTSSISNAICVRGDTGEVVELIGPHLTATFVNSSVELFTQTIETLLNCYPFHAEGAEDAELDTASERLREVIRTVDPVALAESAYWAEFIWDVGMGDYDPKLVRAATVQHRP